MSHQPTVRFIVAEDDFIISMFLETLLTRAGYGVVASVSRGEDAVIQAEALRPDCVLMDIGLAGEMNGVDAAMQLREEQDVPVIFITGNSDIVDRDDRISAIRPLAVWVKPIDDHLFVQRIDSIFAA